MANSEILLYHAADGEPTIQVKLEDETVWLNQDQMAELFQKSKSTINEHIKNILANFIFELLKLMLFQNKHFELLFLKIILRF